MAIVCIFWILASNTTVGDKLAAQDGLSAQCRSVAASQQEVSSLEVRAAKAEQAQGDAMRELREADVAAADQESLLLRAAALEDKLRESRGEQGQLENYKQVSQVVHLLVCTCVEWQLSSACP